MEVRVTSQTKIIKTVRQRPSPEELKKTNGMYRPEDIPSEDLPGSLDELKAGVVSGLVVDSANNIYGKNSFDASEVRYYIVEIQ